jgi:hypothetical protein
MITDLAKSLPDEVSPQSLSLRILSLVEEQSAPSAEEIPEIMTLEQLASFLNISPEDLETENLPGFQIGDELRFRKDRILEWIEEREREYERRLIYDRNRA